MKDNQFGRIDVFIDARGLKCPIPSMKVQLNLLKVPPGGILKLVTDAPHSTKSIPKLCQRRGHKLLLFDKKDGYNVFIIQKKKKIMTSNDSD